MEALTAAVILLTAIAYLIVRIVLFVNATRREKELPESKRDKEQGGESGAKTGEGR